MDVSVLYKRAQRWLYGVARPAVFGNGMLERARATSLALLGFTAAVGLAIVALAANQGWPLIAGSPIPQIPPRHQAVGPAAVVAGLESPTAGADADVAADRAPDGTSAAGRGGGGASPATPSAELVVSPSEPTGQGAGQSPDSPGQAPTPTAPPPRPAVNAPAPTAVAPAPPAQAPPAAEPSSPPVTSSEAPPAESESHVPPWSHGKGHAYGRSSDVDNGWHDDDWDDDGDDWHDHGHGHGHDD